MIRQGLGRFGREFLDESVFVGFLTLLAALGVLVFTPTVAVMQLCCFWPLWLLSGNIAVKVAVQLVWLLVPFGVAAMIFEKLSPPSQVASSTKLWWFMPDFSLGWRIVAIVGSMAIGGMVAGIGWFAWLACIYLWPLWAVGDWSTPQRLLIAPLWVVVVLSLITTIKIKVAIKEH